MFAGFRALELRLQGVYRVQGEVGCLKFGNQNKLDLAQVLQVKPIRMSSLIK